MEKWYNKPITWKKYGILCLIAYAVSFVGLVVYWVSTFGLPELPKFKKKETTE